VVCENLRCSVKVMLMRIPNSGIQPSSPPITLVRYHRACTNRFSLGCGRLFEGTPEQMLNSLDLLAALPAQTRVCCSHEYTLANLPFAEAAEPDNTERDEIVRQIREKRRQNLPSLPSRLDIELACNPFLRTNQPQLWPFWSGKSQLVIQNRLQAFTALRAWKDHFRL